MTTIAERVAAGAAVLDERMPGWADHINLDRLDLRCGLYWPTSAKDKCGCVLAQLDYATFVQETGGPPPRGDWQFVLSRLSDLGAGWADDHGFCLPVDGDDPAWDELTQAWTRAVTARRAGAGGSS